MSPRAAWRLEQLGYESHDYVAGKADWLGWGLPYDGAADLVGDHLTTGVPAARTDETLAAVRERLADSPSGMLVVVNDRDIVLGRLGPELTDAPDDRALTDIMEEGPTTVRPSEEVEALAHRMQHAGVPEIIVTRSDGRLLGTFSTDVPAAEPPGTGR